MPDRFDLQINPASVLAQDSDVNADVSASLAIDSTHRAHVFGLLIMANGAAAAGIVAEYRVGGDVAFFIPIPAEPYAPLYIPLAGNRGVLHDVGDDLELFVPDHGAGVTVSAVIFGQVVGQ